MKLTQPIEWEARNPARNLYRFYRIWMERDLFDQVFQGEINAMSHLDNSKDFYALYESLIPQIPEHQIGGYPRFLQQGPDIKYQEGGGEVLLLKIGCGERISFGDLGVAGFFVPKVDLLKYDFSRLLYYWDCA